MVKIERSFPAPDSLAEEAKKVNGKHDKPDVIERLKKNCRIQMWNIYYRIKMENIQRENLTGKIFSGHVVIVME